MTNGLTVIKKENEGNPKVYLDYSEYFDKNTWERDSFSTEFEIEEYRRGLKELAETGACVMEGKYGSVSISGKTLLRMTMISEAESISIPIKIEELAL
jgi:hypothetical protein